MEIELKQYQGKRIQLTVVDEKSSPAGEHNELEGMVDLVAPDNSALILKPKGQSMTMLIKASNIVPFTVKQVDEKPRQLKARQYDPLGLSNARHHLLDRHAYELSVINGMTDMQALKEHAEIDHDRLGHFHETRHVEPDGTAQEES